VREKALLRKEDSGDDLHTAWHEAAHAVIAHVLGVKVFWLELHADGGETSFDTPDVLIERGKSALDAGMTYGKIAVAGAAASRVGMSGGDNQNLANALWLAGLDEDFFVVRAALMDITSRLVHEHREAIERVATALVERGRLSGEEFRKIMETQNGPSTRPAENQNGIAAGC
jgi:hypothetical protein